MAASHNSAVNVAGIIFYGLVAGFAATVVLVLGSIFLGLLAGWIFNYLGWKHAGKSATVGGLGSVYFTAIPGLVVGVAVCVKVWITRLRRAPAL
jgi:hypothetical protein